MHLLMSDCISLLFVCVFISIYPVFNSGLAAAETYYPRANEENMLFSEKKTLTKAARHYVEILNKIGEPHSDCQSQEIIPLCTKNCRKVRNGKLLFEGRDFFAAQLDAGKEWLGTWSIDVREILISSDKRSAIIRYDLSTEKEGDLVIISILHFDSNYLINEINEVHNKLEKQQQI